MPTPWHPVLPHTQEAENRRTHSLDPHLGSWVGRRTRVGWHEVRRVRNTCLISVSVAFSSTVGRENPGPGNELWTVLYLLSRSWPSSSVIETESLCSQIKESVPLRKECGTLHTWNIENVVGSDLWWRITATFSVTRWNTGFDWLSYKRSGDRQMLLTLHSHSPSTNTSQTEIMSTPVRMSTVSHSLPFCYCFAGSKLKYH